MAEIYLERITHIYGGRTVAVDNLTMDIPNGSFTALLGPSGCGKTTTMNIIAGLLRPTKGRVYFDGEDVTEYPPQVRNVAMVFQFPVVYDKTVYENLAFPLECAKMPKDEIRKRVNEVAEFLGLKEYFNVRAERLDAGMRQKVALGRALVREPSVFLLDEPLTNVDPESRLEIRAKIKEIQKTLNQTMIYVTHDQAEALTLAEKIAVMRKGKIIQYDSPENLYEYPKDTFVAWFIGNPGMNLVSCELKKKGEKYLLDFGEFAIPLEKVTSKMLESRKITMGIRPEHIIVSRERRPEWIQMKCALVERLGTLHLLHLRRGAVEFKAKTKIFEIHEGDDIWVYFPEEKIRIFDEEGKLVY